MESFHGCRSEKHPFSAFKLIWFDKVAAVMQDSLSKLSVCLAKASSLSSFGHHKIYQVFDFPIQTSDINRAFFHLVDNGVSPLSRPQIKT